MPANEEKSLSVAVVSLYGRNNYGNCLQRAAVHRLLENEGCTVESLDARTVSKDVLIERAGCKLSSVFGGFTPKLRRLSRFAAFDSQNNVRQVSLDSLADLGQSYDAFVAGSDQVWNPLMWGFDYRYNLMNFVTPTWKRIALSPSVGLDSIPDEYAESFSRALSGYQRLSVRETSGAQALAHLLGREVEVLPDPTMAFSYKEWSDFADTSFCPTSEYVVVYELGTSGVATARAREYAQENGISLVVLNDASNEYFASGPGDFVGLIFNASVVFTDSFHAAVFSLIGHTPFETFSRGGTSYSMGSRLRTLAEMFSIDMSDASQMYDWEQIDSTRAQSANTMRKYLSDELLRVRGKLNAGA